MADETNDDNKVNIAHNSGHNENNHNDNDHKIQFSVEERTGVSGGCWDEVRCDGTDGTVD